MIFTENKERVRAIPATKYKKNMWRKNLPAHPHLWRESTQMEYSSQKMEKQVWNNKLDWKTTFV